MKLSAWVFQSQLLPESRTKFDIYVLDRFFSGHHKHIFTLNTPEDVFKSWKEAGVDGIEFLVAANPTAQHIEAAKTIFKKNGIIVLSIHQSLTGLFSISLKEITRLFEVAKEFSAKVIVLHLQAIGSKIFDDQFVAELKKLEKKFNIPVGIENSPKNPFALHMPYTWRADEFAEVVISKGFHITLDTTHLAQTGEDIIDFYQKYKTHIINIHISDFRKTFLGTRLLLLKGQHLELGKGELPMRAFLKTLTDTHYDGLVTMEIDTNLEGLCKSAKIIKSIAS
jgi:sugar phosphate isomerase/epimerase